MSKLIIRWLVIIILLGGVTARQPRFRMYKFNILHSTFNQSTACRLRKQKTDFECQMSYFDIQNSTFDIRHLINPPLGDHKMYLFAEAFPKYA